MHALHLLSIVVEFGTSLHDTPSYENTSELFPKPPATHKPLPMPLLLVVDAPLASDGAYAIDLTSFIRDFEPTMPVQRIPFCDIAREYCASPVPPATQSRPFGEIAVVVCPYSAQLTTPVETVNISFAPIPGFHVIPSIV